MFCLTVQLDVHSYSSGDRLAEWVPYVLSARCPAEQNMEATFDDGLLYFCITRDVDVGFELLIWYSDHLAQLLDVPELDNDCRAGRLLHDVNVGSVVRYLYCPTARKISL